MTLKQLSVLYLFLLLGVVSSCNNDTTAAKKPAPDSSSAASDNKTAAPDNTATTSGNEKAPLSTGKKHLSIDTSRNANQPAYEKDRSKNIPAPVSDLPVNKSAGPPGYVTRDDAFLQTEPSAKAPKITGLKKNEIVFILQTIMTNEKGEVTDYPTWYRVERKNKQKGWVIAKAVDGGAGG